VRGPRPRLMAPLRSPALQRWLRLCWGQWVASGGCVGPSERVAPRVSGPSPHPLRRLPLAIGEWRVGAACGRREAPGVRDPSAAAQEAPCLAHMPSAPAPHAPSTSTPLAATHRGTNTMCGTRTGRATCATWASLLSWRPGTLRTARMRWGAGDAGVSVYVCVCVCVYVCMAVDSRWESGGC